MATWCLYCSKCVINAHTSDVNEFQIDCQYKTIRYCFIQDNKKKKKRHFINNISGVYLFYSYHFSVH